ncbi:ammonium transporter [Citricoccus sp. NPDC079358]|uniref:ammonium transporter n=1 Tax=Citricoccus sp. NPDC079358 TaxID=3154653 RepID=UPI00344B300C
MEATDLAWLLAAFALVLLMFPGLALFYGGMLGSRHTLNMIMMVMGALAVTAVFYVVIGHGLVLGDSIGGFIGNPVEMLGFESLMTDDGSGSTFWGAFYVLFAGISIAIVASGAAGRMKFGAWLGFAALWLLLVYSPIAHWVFAFDDEEAGVTGGWLRNVVQLHDFAGGTAVHMNAGMAALALALVLGKRKAFPGRPHNLPLAVLGAGLLWVGWIGFNGGTAGGASFLAEYVVLATLLAGCTGMLGFVIVEKLREGRTTTLGMITGLVAGLVGITPSADAVSPIGALLVGLFTGAAVSWLMTLLPKLKIDEPLDAFMVHGMGGIVGTLCVVLFGAAAAPAGITGVLFGGDWDILWRELVAIVATCLYSFVVTFVIAKAMDKVIGLRVDEEIEFAGLDTSLHAESAYHLSRN